MQAVWLNYRALKAIGVQVWEPRQLRHQLFAAKDTIIHPENLKINARCAVLLFFKRKSLTVMTIAAQKILDGMLSVLAIEPEKIFVVKIYSDKPDLEYLTKSLQVWNPETILQLDMSVAALNVGSIIIQTYSPEFLLEHKQYKAQAYKDLLTLRNILDHGTS